MDMSETRRKEKVWKEERVIRIYEAPSSMPEIKGETNVHDQL
jgi:hypothetical protein